MHGGLSLHQRGREPSAEWRQRIVMLRNDHEIAFSPQVLVGVKACQSFGGGTFNSHSEL